MQGRKKKRFRKGLRSYNCGDPTALEICKKKKINISAEITKMLQRFAYNSDSLQQAEMVLVEKLCIMQDERDREIQATENKFFAEIRSIAQDLAKVQRRLRIKEADEKLK